jgi:hypothetical protein
MSSLRRYEILLPARFNDGQPVPEGLVAATLVELETRFGAVSCESQTIHGLWQTEGVRFRDDLMRIFVDAPDTADTRQFFINFKGVLKVRFKQLEIWVTTYPIDVL